VGKLEMLLAMAGFSVFAYRQALFLEETSRPIVQEGHGSVSFEVIRAHKTKEGTQK
jgi:hypothetical protein